MIFQSNQNITLVFWFNNKKTMYMKKLITLTALGTILAVSQANAAGFLLREQSVAGLGNAFAGASAGAEDASYAFFNPAAIIRQPDQVSFNATAIVGHVKGEGALGYSPTPHPLYANQSEIFAYDNKMNHPVNKMILPSVAATKALDSRNSIGISLSAPFGLVTDYSQQWAGANHGTLSELSVYNLTAMYAHRMTCDLTIAGGLVAQYADATLKNGVLHGVDKSQPAGFALADGISNTKLHGDATDVGYIIGGLYEYTTDTRFGMAYRSKVNHKLKGEISFASNTPLMTQMHAFNQRITAKLTTPALWTMGVYHDINSKWSVMAEAQKTYWSSFDDLTIKGKANHEPLSVTNENWKDAWFYSIGASYRVNEQWKLRFGFAFDQTPVTDGTRTPRIPDSDRYWYAAGFEYKYNDKLTINAGYSFIHAERSIVNLQGTGNDASRGGLYARYKGNIHLFGLGAVYNF